MSVRRKQQGIRRVGWLQVRKHTPSTQQILFPVINVELHSLLLDLILLGCYAVYIGS